MVPHRLWPQCACSLPARLGQTPGPIPVFGCCMWNCNHSHHVACKQFELQHPGVQWFVDMQQLCGQSQRHSAKPQQFQVTAYLAPFALLNLNRTTMLRLLYQSKYQFAAIPGQLVNAAFVNACDTTAWSAALRGHLVRQ